MEYVLKLGWDSDTNLQETFPQFQIMKSRNVVVQT
jgi:hypothetical protein